jgi:hypothetical protein
LIVVYSNLVQSVKRIGGRGELEGPCFFLRTETDAQSILRCRLHRRNPHWHIVYGEQDRHIFVDWDNSEDEGGKDMKIRI